MKRKAVGWGEAEAPAKAAAAKAAESVTGETSKAWAANVPKTQVVKGPNAKKAARVAAKHAEAEANRAKMAVGNK